MKWGEYPFLRLTIGIAAGVLLNNMIKCVNSQCYFLLLLSAIFCCFYIISFWKHSTFFAKKYEGFLGLSSFILLGYMTSQLNYSIEKPQLSHEELKASSYYSVSIVSNPVKTKKTAKYEAIIDKIKINDTWLNVSEKAIIYLVSEDLIENRYGDKLLVKGNPEYFKSQTNPYAFDYSKYMSRRGFYLQDFVQKNQILWVSNEPKYSIKYFSLLAGNYFEQLISDNITGERELNMIRAMVIGRRSEITSEMEDVYQSTGTSHILAVSGLHVGIIFLIFSNVLKSLKKGRFRLIYYGAILFVIWSFAFITGSSPSVLRASLMISIILTGEILSRKSNIYNSILVSAFFLLLFDPNLLYSVSFQLSYVAVLGIVYLYSKIYRLVYIKYSFFNFFWKITALSLSAQISTFPITIYYFHQFPTLSLFTNLLAIPTATVVIPASFIILILHPIAFLAKIVGAGLEGMVFYYNNILSWVSRFEFAVITEIYMESIYVFVIFTALFFLVRFIETRKLYLFRFLTIVLIFIAAISVFKGIKYNDQVELAFYDIQSKSYLDLFIGGECYTNVKPEDATDTNIHFNITPNRMHHKISSIKSIYESKYVRRIGRNTLIVRNNISILILEGLTPIPNQSQKPQIDYLVLGNNSMKYLPKLANMFEYQTLIFDSSINSKDVYSLTRKLKITSKIHSISSDGAYIICI